MASTAPFWGVVRLVADKRPVPRELIGAIAPCLTCEARPLAPARDHDWQRSDKRCRQSVPLGSTLGGRVRGALLDRWGRACHRTNDATRAWCGSQSARLPPLRCRHLPLRWVLWNLRRPTAGMARPGYSGMPLYSSHLDRDGDRPRVRVDALKLEERDAGVVGASSLRLEGTSSCFVSTCC